MTTYYTVTGNPISLSRGASSLIRAEYTLVQTGFATVNTEMTSKGAHAGQTWTGTHSFTGATITVPTQAQGDSTTKAASTSFVTTYYAPLASPPLTGTPTAPTAALGTSTTQLATTAFAQTMQDPAFTGTPTVPTASAGTATTQIASCAFVVATSFSAALPGQTGNSGKFVTTDGSNASWASVYPTQTSNSGKFLQTNGTTTAWAFAGVSQVTTATTATTLTSTPTLLKITPTTYGVTVTLPDATTCSVGGPLHIIDNRGAYPVRVCDSTGVLKAFVFAGVVSHISLDDNSTAAGVWAIENGELVGASAQLLTTTFGRVYACVDLGSSRECLIGGTANSDIYGVVYDSSTNTFGSVTLIRTMTSGTLPAQAVLSAANQVLVVSCNNAAALEAVCLTITGTSIAVGTAATATLSANANTTAFADGCGLIAVGSSFVTSYTVVTPAAQIRALSISGTTVTIGSATVLDGTAGGLIAASGSYVIAASTATTHLYTKPYLVSGSTLTAGTGTDTSRATSASLNKFALMGSYWLVCDTNGNGDGFGSIVTLSGTGNGTTTISTPATCFYGTVTDAIVVSSTKALLLGSQTSANANVITNTAGTASAGTAITLTSGTTRAALYTDGTSVLVGNASNITTVVNCSGASPTLTKTLSLGAAPVTTSNAVLSRSPNNGCYSATGLQGLSGSAWREFVGLYTGKSATAGAGNNFYRGKSAAETWISDAATVITKYECVV